MLHYLHYLHYIHLDVTLFTLCYIIFTWTEDYSAH